MGHGLRQSFRREEPMGDAERLMRCDLHVHSRHSGAATLPVLRHVARECYSEPRAVIRSRP